MKTTLVVPANPFIRKFIQYFFFIRNDDKTYDKTHICYPNTNYCLGLHKGNKLAKSSAIDYKVLASGNYESYLTGIYQKPIQVRYKGVFREVCIDFEPMGLEMLTGVEISNNVYIQNVIDIVLPKYRERIFDIAFSNDDPYSCAAKLEHFFLANMPNKNRFEYSEFNTANVNQVDGLKKIFNKSYRSIHRLYRSSLDISPKEFLAIQRFRRCVDQIHSAKSLADIAYLEGFSDQAHMTREFKKITGLSPKAFRAQSKMVDETLCWTFE